MNFGKNMYQYTLSARLFWFDLIILFRVARWFVFKPKIPIWVNFGGSCGGRCWYILWPLGLFYGRLTYIMRSYLVYFMAIWYISPFW
jgi:hypothetical protein